MMATVPQITQHAGGFCACRTMEVNRNMKRNMKSPERGGSGLLGTSDVLLALGAISIHRSGLEAALPEPLEDLVFREADI